MRHFTFVLIALLLAPSSYLSAQDPQPVEVGERVRVKYDCTRRRSSRGNWVRVRCQKEEGTLVALTSDSMVLQPAGQLNSPVVPLITVTRLDVRRGLHSHPWRGVFVGALVGGVATGAANTGNCLGWECVRKFANGSIVGLASGAIFGAGIGAFIKTERWEEIPLDRVSVSFGPRRDGFAFGMTVSF